MGLWVRPSGGFHTHLGAWREKGFRKGLRGVGVLLTHSCGVDRSVGHAAMGRRAIAEIGFRERVANPQLRSGPLWRTRG